ncbi:MAG: DinB family protein [Gemmatimonadales bacterium]
MTGHALLRPAEDEYSPYFATYIGHVPAGDVLETLTRQLDDTAAFLAMVSPSQAAYRYAPGKWSVKEIVGHLSDAERIFAYRALRFGRGDPTPLSSFDENRYVPESGADARSIEELAQEFAAVRRATLALLAGLPPAAWSRRGEASGKMISVRALAWIIAGHELHHLGVLRSRYGL